MRRRVSGFDVFFALLGGFFLYLVILNVPQVVAAARSGVGVQGVFTAERQTCVEHVGHQACDWQGDFRSDDGRVIRTDITLYGGTRGLAQGGRTRARDVGRASTVYRPDGTHEWIVSMPIGVSGVLLFLKGAVFGLGRGLFARSSARAPHPETAHAHSVEGARSDTLAD